MESAELNPSRMVLVPRVPGLVPGRNPAADLRAVLDLVPGVLPVQLVDPGLDPRRVKGLQNRRIGLAQDRGPTAVQKRAVRSLAPGRDRAAAQEKAVPGPGRDQDHAPALDRGRNRDPGQDLGRDLDVANPEAGAGRSPHQDLGPDPDPDRSRGLGRGRGVAPAVEALADRQGTKKCDR